MSVKISHQPKWCPIGKMQTMVDERFSTPEQDDCILDIQEQQHCRVTVVPHTFISSVVDGETRSRQDDALVECDGHVFFIRPDGWPEEPVSTPYPWCSGNPSKAHCVLHGYCPRNPGCGD